MFCALHILEGMVVGGWMGGWGGGGADLTRLGFGGLIGSADDRPAESLV